MFQVVGLIVMYLLVVILASWGATVAQREYDEETNSVRRWEKLETLTAAEWLQGMAIVFGWMPAMVVAAFLPK